MSTTAHMGICAVPLAACAVCYTQAAATPCMRMLSSAVRSLVLLRCTFVAGALGLPAQGPNGPVPIMAEEIVRGSAAAALSLLLTAVEPR